ncbi:MAG: hypothetical protein AB8H80_18925 [Planctomycetota bacterium]
MTQVRPSRDVCSTRVKLRMLSNREASFGRIARREIDSMLADLDVVMLRLPDDPPDDLCTELERIATTIRNADAELINANRTAAGQLLALAQARLRRFVGMVEELPDVRSA